jgi:hypothetical protein
MDRLLSMRVFQKVIDEEGFAAAARVLDMSPAGDAYVSSLSAPFILARLRASSSLPLIG